jgi:hypothetical protein
MLRDFILHKLSHASISGEGHHLTVSPWSPEDKSNLRLLIQTGSISPNEIVPYTDAILGALGRKAYQEYLSGTDIYHVCSPYALAYILYRGISLTHDEVRGIKFEGKENSKHTFINEYHDERCPLDIELIAHLADMPPCQVIKWRLGVTHD